MTIFLHELRQNRNTILIWTGAVAFLMMVCVFLFPEMKSEAESIGDMFSSMGGFTAAFGMDRLNFGEFLGFYGIECGNILGLGGACFAALAAISTLAGEEKEHTADFLLTHPVSRERVLTEKLCAVGASLLIFHAVVLVLTVVSILVVGEEPDWSRLLLLHLAYLLLSLETGAVCFGISAFGRRNGYGIGLGLAAGFYFLNIIANLSEKAVFLKYITPFGYAESADILSEGSLHTGRLAFGMFCSAAGILAAYLWYAKKDIR